MSSKTIVFDLDDTLVKEVEYLKSAFFEIACNIEKGGHSLYDQMLTWYYDKENVFQNLIEIYPDISIESLKSMYRLHRPNFKRYSYIKAFLNELKKKGYKLGLITDGFSITQRNKINSLGIENIFDLIIISEEFGSEKPSYKNYVAFHRFNTEKYYYIGDNLKKDFITPNKLNWITICLLNDGNNIHLQDFDIDASYLPKYRIKQLDELSRFF